MSQNISEKDQKTLNSLGSHVSPQEIQKNKLYLAYYITDGLVDIIFLWNSTINTNSGYSVINFKNRKRPQTIQLTSNDKTEILKTLQNFQHLDSLYFQNFFIPTDSLELIGDLIGLKKFSITNRNPIIFPNLKKLSKLTEVRITISKKPFQFSKSLKNLQNLEKFHIGTDLRKFPEFILNFKKLTYLSLQSNSIPSIPESIGDLRNLREMNLYNNELSSLPHSIKNLKNLTRLNIGRNNFTRIPENIKHLKNLESIDISYNPFVSLESFRYLFFNPALTIISDFASSKNYKLSIGGLTIPKEVKNYWHEKNYEGIMQYYTPPIIEIAQKYAHNPKSLTHHELKRLETEVTEKERRILELTLPKNDPILRIINEKLKIELSNGFGLMR
nr:leucine-rich repeat domain-containing protein [Candidatus Prometheoarchaeum syntrophicum]QEE16135.1 Leucine Rich repeats (2 copies) [Candidatus Prometheoarchaeum syntrophicum]